MKQSNSKLLSIKLFSFLPLFVLFCPSFMFAYLDPGSGSLLLSSLVALGASIVFFLKTLFYKIIALFTGDLAFHRASVIGGGGGNPQRLVFYSEGSQYYGTFKPILDTLDSLSHPYTFYTSDKDDPALQRPSQSTHQAQYTYIGQGNKAYSLLNRLKADILVLTTPGLDVLHIKRQAGVKHYCHIVHSLTPMTYRVFGVDYFDSVLVSNAIQQDFIRDIESAHGLRPKHIAIVGSTYLDELFKLSSQIQTGIDSQTSTSIQPLLSESSHLDSVKSPDPKTSESTQIFNSQALLETARLQDSNSINPQTLSSQSCVLVSPSWGRESLLMKYGLKLLLPLAQSGFELIIRPHPQSYIGPQEKANLESLEAALKSYTNVKWDRDTPNVYAFAKSNIMISDFSSVIFDYVCLQHKPVITIDIDMDLSGYDMADLPKESIWTFQALTKIGRRIKPCEFENLASIIHYTIAQVGIKEDAKEAQTSQDSKDTQTFAESQITKNSRVAKDSTESKGLDVDSQLTHNLAHNLQSIQMLLWAYPHRAGLLSTLELLKIEQELIESRLKPHAKSLFALRELEHMRHSLSSLSVDSHTPAFPPIPSQDFAQVPLLASHTQSHHS